MNNYKILKSKNDSILKSVDIFCGCGGMSIGLENSGIQPILLLDNDKDCIKTIKKNRPTWNTILSDIRDYDFSNIKADIVSGGFPCQSFSYAGEKSGFEDVRGTLFFEYARCVKEIMPKVFIAENVRGLINNDGGRTMSKILSVFEEIGYSVKWKLMKSQFYDVPQRRERVIFVGVRKDLNNAYEFPKENKYTISLRDALDGCPDSFGVQYSEKKKNIMNLIPPGGYWKDLPKQLQIEYLGKSIDKVGGKTSTARRLTWDEPCLTLTCNPAQKQTERCHPDETRPLKIREYARIQTFPDDWDFVGSNSSQYRQIGNAVPCNLSFHIGNSIVEFMKRL